MEEMLEDCSSYLEDEEWQNTAPYNPPIWRTGERLDLLSQGGY
jgi:hypothetical protein